MALPYITKPDDVSGDIVPMDELLSTSDKERTSNSIYQHWMSDDHYGRPGLKTIQSTWLMQHMQHNWNFTMNTWDSTHNNQEGYWLAFEQAQQVSGTFWWRQPCKFNKVHKVHKNFTEKLPSVSILEKGEFNVSSAYYFWLFMNSSSREVSIQLNLL